MVVRGLIVAAALLVGSDPLPGQVSCSAPPTELVRSVTVAPAVRLTPQQQVVVDRLVAAVRAGNAAATHQELATLVRLRTGAAQPADACALVLRAVRLGKVESDPRTVTTLRLGGAGAIDTSITARAYESAVQTIANIQQQIWADALKILANLKA